MPLPYVHIPDLNGAKGDGLSTSDILYSATLTAGGGDTTLTVPSSAAPGLPRQGANNYLVAKIVTETASTVWLAMNQTAAVPVGATFAAVSSELIPPETEIYRRVKAADVMHFITADAAADISVTFYTLQ